MTTTKQDYKKWENRLSQINIGEQTRQLLIAQGRLQDLCTFVSSIITDYWGEDQADVILEKFCEAHGNLSDAIQNLTSDIMYAHMCTSSENYL
ncbi:MAG: hypothetical protein R3Y08_08570 [Rikenellaceae bacterium]